MSNGGVQAEFNADLARYERFLLTEIRAGRDPEKVELFNWDLDGLAIDKDALVVMSRTELHRNGYRYFVALGVIYRYSGTPVWECDQKDVASFIVNDSSKLVWSFVREEIKRLAAAMNDFRETERKSPGKPRLLRNEEDGWSIHVDEETDKEP